MIIHLKFTRSEILHKLRAAAYITADNMIVDNEKIKSSIMDIGEEGRVGRVNTFINRAWGEICHILSGYVLEVLDTPEPYFSALPIILASEWTLNGEHKDNEMFLMEISVHDNFQPISSQALVDAIEDYMVYSALYGYFAIVKKDESEYYNDMMSKCVVKAKNTLASRRTPRRIRMFPCG